MIEASHHNEIYPFEAIAELKAITHGQTLAYCTIMALFQFLIRACGVIIPGRHLRLSRNSCRYGPWFYDRKFNTFIPLHTLRPTIKPRHLDG